MTPRKPKRYEIVFTSAEAAYALAICACFGGKAVIEPKKYDATIEANATRDTITLRMTEIPKKTRKAKK